MNERKSFQIQNDIIDNRVANTVKKRKFCKQCSNKNLEKIGMSKMNISDFNNKAGITLIALVISIIVMLILAGVSLNATIGDNGIITQAQNAKQAQEDAVWDEEAQTIITEALMNKDEIEALSEEQKTEAGNDNEKIENYKRENMRAYLQNKFQEKSSNTVIVSRYAEGYLIVDGERVFIAEKDLSEYVNAKSQRLLVANDEEWTFKELTEGTCSITAYNKELKGTILIPAVLISKETEKAYIVEELGDDVFNYATQIKKVDFSQVGSTLKRIGARTFMNCTNLEINIPNDLPSSIESIGYKAFYNCKKLTGNIDEIQNAGIVLGQGVFMNCSNLSGSIQSVFDQTFYIEENGQPSATVVEEGQFSGFSGLTGNLTIPYYITEIKNNAFYGCTGIESLNFDEGTTGSQLISIGDSAFEACTGLKNKLVIPSEVRSIGEYCFKNSFILGLELDKNLENIGQGAFYNCSNIEGKIIIPEKVKNINYETFAHCYKIEEVEFESNNGIGCKSIEMYGFLENTSLKKIIFPSTLEKIGHRAFDWGYKLEEVYLPDSITFIDFGAFWSQYKMTIIHWPEKLETIGDNAFVECYNLKILPNTKNLKSIGKEAFKDCNDLGKINEDGKTNVINWLSNSKITTIGENCFENDSYLTGEFLGTIKNSNNQAIAINGSIFTNTSITRTSDITNIGNTIADNQYSGSTKFIKNGKEVTEIEIPSGVASIGKNAFAGCTSITKVKIPATVTNISNGTFMNCTNLTTIEFENGINIDKIPSYFCYNNKNLSNINLPDSITQINGYAFYYCNLTKLSLPQNVKSVGNFSFQNTKLTELTLNEGLESIGYSAFRWNNIKSVVIPDTVTHIENTVFNGCGSLESITLGKGITSINGYFVSGCANLKEIIVRGTITRIEDIALQNDTSLTLKGIKGLDWEKVLYIGENAFANCTSLKGTVKVNKECNIHERAAVGSGLEFTK